MYGLHDLFTLNTIFSGQSDRLEAVSGVTTVGIACGNNPSLQHLYLLAV